MAEEELLEGDEVLLILQYFLNHQKPFMGLFGLQFKAKLLSSRLVKNTCAVEHFRDSLLQHENMECTLLFLCHL